MTNKMMKLQENVQKATEKVEKIKKTIDRHETQLVKKVAIVEKMSGSKVDLNNVDAHKWDANGKSFPYYSEAYDITWKLDDIKGSKSKLVDAERILEGHKAKLKKEQNNNDFVNNNVPQVILDFLEEWKVMATDWHVKKLEAYKVKKKALYAEEKKASAECAHMSYRERRAYMDEKNLDNVGQRLMNFAGVVVIEMSRIKDEEERLSYLENILEQEKQRKAIDLVTRIKDVVGDITDATGLRVNDKLNLDGIIIGTEGKAKINTIGAGGYNIVCFHYRTLVNKIE